MAEKQLATWKRVLAYVAFFLFALVASFFLTFPYDTLKERVRTEAESAGYFVRINSLGPGFFSIRASGIELSKKAAANIDAPPESLKIDSVSVGPSLFPPSLKVSSSLLGGSASARVGGLRSTNVKVVLDEIDVSKGNVKGFTGIDMSGEIDGLVELEIPRAGAESDFSQANGNVSLVTRGLTVNGGTANVAIPMYGPEPTPIDLPKIQVGEVNGKVKIEKGLATVDDFKGKSPDIELNVSGTLKLAKRVEYSEPNLEVRFKPDSAFQSRLGLLGSALSMVGPDPKDPNWRMGRLTGMLGRPNFR